MPIVTLTSDVGYRDPYLGMVKARIYKGNPDAKIIDLSCEVRPNAIKDAAFVLKNTLADFPENTIHLVAVKLIVNNSQMNAGGKGVDNTRYLLTRYQKQYILTPDNGLFTLIDEGFNEKVYQVYFDNENKHIFFLRDIFVDIALHIMDGKPISDLTVETKDYYKAFDFNSYKNENQLRGRSVYVDDYGNIITNITRKEFYEMKGDRTFEIVLPGTAIEEISTTYDDVKFGEPLALFNSFGLLEIAINGKSAYQMLHPRQIGKDFEFNLMIEFND